MWEAEAPPDFPLSSGREGSVVGIADEGAGVRAFVAGIGGAAMRPDGPACRIPCSPTRVRKPIESDDVIRGRGCAASGRRHHRVRPGPEVFA